MKKRGNIKGDENDQHEEDKDEQHGGDIECEEGKETAHSVPGERKTPTKAVKGKYTAHNNGTTKYGGWSDTGMAHFNELYKLVKEDRKKCPQAAAMENEFLEYACYYAHHSK